MFLNWRSCCILKAFFRAIQQFFLRNLSPIKKKGSLEEKNRVKDHPLIMWGWASEKRGCKKNSVGKGGAKCSILWRVWQKMSSAMRKNIFPYISLLKKGPQIFFPQQKVPWNFFLSQDGVLDFLRPPPRSLMVVPLVSNSAPAHVWHRGVKTSRDMPIVIPHVQNEVTLM